MKFSFKKLVAYQVKDEVSDLLFCLALLIGLFQYAFPEFIYFNVLFGLFVIIPADIVWCWMVFKHNKQLSEKAKRIIKFTTRALIVAIGCGVVLLLVKGR